MDSSATTRLPIPTELTGELIERKGPPGRAKGTSKENNYMSTKGRKSLVGKDVIYFTDNQWAAFLAQIAEGVSVPIALKTSKITGMALQAAIRGNEKRRIAYEDAKLTALRIGWDVDIFEDILVKIAMGSPVQTALKEIGRSDERSMAHFYKLILKDPVLRAQYDDARLIQAEKMAIDDLIEISDDESGDETWDGKPNSAKVNRDKLRTDSRKWIAARMHHKRFGDKIQQEVTANVVVDHAARLEAARKRKELAHRGGNEK